MEHCFGVDFGIDVFKVSFGMSVAEESDKLLDLLLVGVVAKPRHTIRPDGSTASDIALGFQCLVILNGLLNYLTA